MKLVSRLGQFLLRCLKGLWQIILLQVFTPTEKRAIIFLCCVLCVGAVVRVTHFSSYKAPPDRDEGKPLVININTASSRELQKLPSIGEKTAAAIIEYRTVHGDFAEYEEITGVSGIGEKKLERIRPFITFEDTNFDN